MGTTEGKRRRKEKREKRKEEKTYEAEGDVDGDDGGCQEDLKQRPGATEDGLEEESIDAVGKTKNDGLLRIEDRAGRLSTLLASINLLRLATGDETLGDEDEVAKDEEGEDSDAEVAGKREKGIVSTVVEREKRRGGGKS